MKIVVDTNIVFSALLNSNSFISKLLICSDDSFEFYSSNILKNEILRHWDKILKYTKLNEDQVLVSLETIYSKIRFIEKDLIPKELKFKALNYSINIDIDDTEFIEVSLFLNAKLWTGDKALYEGLKAKEFQNVINTFELNILKNDILNA
jgi:predicted nucleic acid-binding protein